MSSPAVPQMGHDSPTTNPGPRAGGPSRRRTFTPTEKLDLLSGYEEAIAEQKGGAYAKMASTPRKSPNGANYATQESSKEKQLELVSASLAPSKLKLPVFAAS